MPRRKRLPDGTPAPSQAETLAALLMSAPKERRQELVDAIWDAACGHRLYTGEARKPGGKGLRGQERQVKVTDIATGEEVVGWFYDVPGDPQAQKLLLEHGMGRPAQRETARKDMVVNLICRVPEKRLVDFPKSGTAEAAALDEATLLVETPAVDEFAHLAAIDLSLPEDE